MIKRFRWGAATGLLVFGTAVILFRRWFRRRSREVLSDRAVEYVIPCDVEEGGIDELAAGDLVDEMPDQKTVASQECLDDLTKIEGLGPKSARVLATAGISSFGQLEASSVEQLRQILDTAGLRIVHPDTWPEQAGLAARGNWTGLKALQAQLDRGRRTKS